MSYARLLPPLLGTHVSTRGVPGGLSRAQALTSARFRHSLASEVRSSSCRTREAHRRRGRREDSPPSVHRSLEARQASLSRLQACRQVRAAGRRAGAGCAAGVAAASVPRQPQRNKSHEPLSATACLSQNRPPDAPAGCPRRAAAWTPAAAGGSACFRSAAAVRGASAASANGSASGASSSISLESVAARSPAGVSRAHACARGRGSRPAGCRSERLQGRWALRREHCRAPRRRSTARRRARTPARRGLRRPVRRVRRR